MPESVSEPVVEKLEVVCLLASRCKKLLFAMGLYRWVQSPWGLPCCLV